MLNELLNIISKIEGKVFTDKIDKKYLYQIINWEKLNYIFQTSYINFSDFLIEENKINKYRNSNIFDYLFEEKNMIIKKINMFDINLLNLSFEISKKIKAYIDINLEIDNTFSKKELNIKNNEIILFQLYGSSDIEVYNNENKECFKFSFNEGDLIYLPNGYSILKQSKNTSMYLYLNIFSLSNFLYMEWLSRNILFESDFILNHLSLKENLKVFIKDFKEQILEAIDNTSNDYLKKQINVINKPTNINFPDIFIN